MDLNQITLPVTSMSAASEFYRKLGCLQIVDTPHYARFESPRGAATFSLSLVAEVTNPQAIVYFEVDDVDKSVARLQRHGIAFDELPADKPWLWREASLCDPAGNRIKLYQAGSNRRFPPWRVERTDC